ncbi:MAG: transcription termination factor NusA [candidate division WOR-3 bacterium]
MSKEIATMLAQLARVRNVDIVYVVETLRSALISGLRRKFGEKVEPEVEINPETGEMRIFLRKVVTETVSDPFTEISLEEAQKIFPEAKLGEMVKVELPTSEISRSVVMWANDELTRRLREAEKVKLFKEYQDKLKKIVTGTIHKITEKEIIVNLGVVEGILLPKDQLKNDSYRQGQPIKAYVYKVEKTPVGPKIYLSRSHPDFLRRLLEKEVPEIKSGVVKIQGIVRGDGRAKVAVVSTDDKIDPVGACVGFRRQRIENIVKELSGEKVDIIHWSRDPKIFISRALGPAKVIDVFKEEDSWTVICSDKDFPIAIGKSGQNVHLASKLVGAKITVIRESDYKNRLIMEKAKKFPLREFPIPKNILDRLLEVQVLTAFDLLSPLVEDLAQRTGLEVESLEALRKEVRERLAEEVGSE